MYYYDDNRDRVHFPNEDEFRAYYIIFSIHDQRPDLEARVQKWPAELRNSPRVQMALELLAAAGNTWEYQGTLDAKRPNAIAQGFYTRFFNLVDSPGVSYLMACVAEIYFNHVRQTAIRSIWKGYCRYPSSQQHKNEEWTVSELTTVLCFDNEDQTIEFCEEQDLGFAENAQGHRYLNWGSRPVDSVAFQPSSDHSFSERYVESKRAGRTLVAIILGLNIKEAATLGMIETYLLPQRIQPGTANDDSLFVSDDDNKVLPSSPQPNALLANGPATSDSPVSASSLDNSFNESSETPARDEMSIVTQAPKTSQPGESNLFSSIFSTATPKSVFPTPAAPSPFSGLTSVFTKPSETKSGSFSFSAPQTSQQPAPIFPAGQTPSTLLKDANKAPLFPSVAPSFGTQNPFSLDKTAFNSPFNNTTAPDNTTKPLLSVTAGQSPSGTFDGTKISTAPSRNTSTFNFPSQATGFGGMGAQQHQPTPLAFSLSNLGNTPAALSRLPSSSAPTEDEGKPAFSFSPAATTLSNLTPKTPAAASPSVSEAKPLENKHIDSDTHKVADTPALTQEHASSLNHNIIQRPESSSLSGSTSVKASDVSVASQPSTDSTSVDESFASLTEQTTSEDLPSTDVNDQRVQWIEALKEVAEKRRRTSSMSRKRAHDDPEEEQSAENGSKPPKASKPEVPTARPKSMALFSTKPLPKLPILEHIEALVSRKHSAEQFESPKPTQVDEDEILLSAARIAAETLRSGPKLLDSWPYHVTNRAKDPVNRREGFSI
ncbi:hypothetical protein EYZ11_008400 [Aspergillus tanneri]|uniref:SAC3/GANP/THP3 conserved domain-containing protein n=1 Tax=Aspergillus tanneri TaxID=1220188 RepID=A0A4S3JAW4_9EURO|nr:hypothetical protein EYZ11_008400 [Aspergillus tanneri]